MNLTTHYQRLLEQYGDSPEASQWSSRESQEKRFEILTQIGELEGCDILDFGCGTGHLATYLIQRGLSVNYIGVEIIDELLAIGRQKHPNHQFCRLEEVLDHKFDYVIISGVFNNKIKDNQKFYQEILEQCFSMAKRGVAFNLLSYYVDYYDDSLFYERPEKIFRYIKENISPYVTIRNDYQVKPGILPFEFTGYIYRIGEA